MGSVASLVSRQRWNRYLRVMTPWVKVFLNPDTYGRKFWSILAKFLHDSYIKLCQRSKVDTRRWSYRQGIRYPPIHTDCRLVDCHRSHSCHQRLSPCRQWRSLVVLTDTPCLSSTTVSSSKRMARSHCCFHCCQYTVDVLFHHNSHFITLTRSRK